MFSIFCPYRNRQLMYDDFILHYSYVFPNANIYMLEQDDDAPFMRGQLMNAAFNALKKRGANLDGMMFIDVDIRLEYAIDFESLLHKYNTVVIPYDKLELFDILDVGTYISIKKPSYFLAQPDGGVTLFTADQFERCNGFSNLYIGWGLEDSDFVRRNTITRISNTMIHLQHKRHSEWNTDVFKLNVKNSKLGTDYKLDGFNQTSAETSVTQIKKNVYKCKIKNISVIQSYKYNDRLMLSIRAADVK